ncbi:DUF1654 domain-containing protein [Pseudomonas kermanshahensis]|uniref:DUF1654 domain-containing protein n=1 Tax=Pseudomonas kermanshahensis TaxID=2745482 RepID=UPI0023DC74FC|nr:DUF1654 domain-containing protein [Pseudomonas kermanshahensis]WEL58019.1 DUF1654 domain-containing protein [Pseudomonas kermanshahensis]
MRAAQGLEMSAPREELTGLERLGLRVSAMINSPLAQFGRRVLIHQLDIDSDQDWEAIMELLSETDGLDMMRCDDGSVILQWDAPTDDDRVIEREVDLHLVHHDQEDAPF